MSELLKPGQWVEVISAPAWPDLVGLRTTIKEVIPYGSRLDGGPAYVLNVYISDKQPLQAETFLSKPEEVRLLPQLKPVEIHAPEPVWHVAIEHEGEYYEAFFTINGELVTVTYGDTQKTAPLDGLAAGRRAEAILLSMLRKS